MKRLAMGLPVFFVLALMPLVHSASVAYAGDEPITAKDLKALQVPGRVLAVLWTKRPERCTLQIVFPNAGRIPQAMLNRPQQRPKVQAWLLRADGSAIPSIERTELVGGPRNAPFGVEVLFAFPPSADAEAVAVALRVDDQYLIERLATS